MCAVDHGGCFLLRSCTNTSGGPVSNGSGGWTGQEDCGWCASASGLRNGEYLYFSFDNVDGECVPRDWCCLLAIGSGLI